jgi:hypothetical protein
MAYVLPMVIILAVFVCWNFLWLRDLLLSQPSGWPLIPWIGDETAVLGGRESGPGQSASDCQP